VFIGKRQEVFVATVFAFHTGKAVMQIAAVEIPVNDILQIGPPEVMLPGEMLVVRYDHLVWSRGEV
jgi:hypothetical protein